MPRKNKDPESSPVFTGVNSVSGELLTGYIERIERKQEETVALKDDIKEIFVEAKCAGFDIPIIRMLLKRRVVTKEKIKEREEMLELYERAMGDYTASGAET